MPRVKYKPTQIRLEVLDSPALVANQRLGLLKLHGARLVALKDCNNLVSAYARQVLRNYPHIGQPNFALLPAFNLAPRRLRNLPLGGLLRGGAATPQLHACTASRLYSYTASQRANVPAYRCIGISAYWRIGVPDKFQAASRPCVPIIVRSNLPEKYAQSCAIGTFW